jgi:2-dehydropantoate 2-reductase
MDRLEILVFGAGAIGTYIGGSLAVAGHRLTFLEQPRGVADLRRGGLRLEIPAGRAQPPLVHTLGPDRFRCAASLEDAIGMRRYDLAILALKSFDTAAALASIRPLQADFPPVLCLSNGVDNEPQLAEVLGGERVIAGTVTSAVGRRGVGDIAVERVRGIGLADGHPLSAALAQALQEAGLHSRLYPQAADMKWSKMLTNLPANATAAILDMTAAEVFAHPGLFDLEMRMLGETLDVMKALGLRVVDLPGTPVRALAFGIRLPQALSRPLLGKAVGGGRGGKMPSFHIDLHSGRGRSEVDWLNGAVVRRGEAAGVPAPVNRLLNETLLGLTRGGIPLDAFSRRPEKLLELSREL